MAAFVERTGLDPERGGTRYLWTDAFALCNLLALARATGERRWSELALVLVERVHGVLGRHRPDDVRRGWLSGLGEEEGAAHPTRSGLRIGKRLPERQPREPFDEQLEWDRDGQYFHYLTKWMHALDQLARATREPRFNRFARELAVTAHARFCFRPRASDPPRMHWKMSIDLTRPLVASMGQHDPLDGFITCVELAATAEELGDTASGPSVETALSDFAAMLERSDLLTADPLGLGGLLSDAYRWLQLLERGSWEDSWGDGGLVERMLAAAREGLVDYAARSELRAPASHRLGFRELGLAIGLATATRHPRLAAFAEYVPLRRHITAFWLDPAHRRSASWTEHLDINEVMLATSLLPEGFLELSRP